MGVYLAVPGSADFMSYGDERCNRAQHGQQTVTVVPSPLGIPLPRDAVAA
jgi:hypothetical protein